MTFSVTSPKELSQNRSTGLLLDVRTPAEFDEIRIEGAILKPLHELDPEEIKPLTQGKTACYVICRSGGRARQAAERLVQGGITSVTVLEGGVLAWEKEGLPVLRGMRKTISLERQVRITAGGLVVIGSTLGYFVSPTWIALSAFVGAGLVFAGITDTCGLAMVLARMPWNNRGCTSASHSCAMR